MIAVIFFCSLVASLVGGVLMVPRLGRTGIFGHDLHKSGRPKIPEMGGLITVAGFGAGVLMAVGLMTFFPLLSGVNYVHLLAVLSTVLLTTLIGIVDDLMDIRQLAKAFLPLVAALPLVTVQIGRTWMELPLFGRVEFGILYPLILVPVGITGAANALNMLGGFNGLELGMGLAAMGSLALIAAMVDAPTSLLLLVAGCGALLGTLPFNRYPAKVFVGDVGTLSMGAIIAASVMIGGLQAAGLIVIVPYMVDFVLKALHRFPTTGWAGELGEDGKLRCPAHGPVSLPQLVMKLTGGVSEKSLVLILTGVEAVFGLIAVVYYALL